MAITFDFSYHQLISQAPIYALDSTMTATKGLISKMLQFPWKYRLDDKTAESLPPVLHVYLLMEGWKQIDAVRGYVGKSGDFCGLLFRRDGSWESNVCGHLSAYELAFELAEGEPFTRISFLEEDLKTMGAE